MIARLLALAMVFAPALVFAGEGMPSILEVKGQFVYASKAQVAVALNAAKLGQDTKVLTPQQFEIVLSSLKEGGAEVFSEMKVVSQSGGQMAAQTVQQIPLPDKYEPSKREPGKSIPTGFESRNSGITLEGRADVLPKGEIQFAIIPEITRFLGYYDSTNAKPSSNGDLVVEELLKAPLAAGTVWKAAFASFKEKASFTMKDGETAMIGGQLTLEQLDEKKLTRTTAPEEVCIFFTVKKVVRD